MALSPDQVARLRLQSLGLTGPGVLGAGATPRDVVSQHLAMQAQDWTASRWAIGARLAAAGAPATDAVVMGAYDAGAIVRGWPMRGTVHVVAAEDLRWLNDLAGRRALSGVARRWAMLGIDEPFLERAREAITELLSDGEPRTRDRLAAELAGRGFPLDGGVRYHVIWYLTQTGSLVLGPVDPATGDHAVTLQHVHLPEPVERAEAEAERELAERYLRLHGPAQIADLVWWSGMTKTAIARGVAALGDKVVALDAGGRSMLMLAERAGALDPDCGDSGSATIALTGFDEHLRGLKDRSDVLEDRHAALVDPGRNGVFRATIVQDGRVIATWSRKALTHHVRVTVSPFRALSAARRRRIVQALAPWGAFVGRDLDVQFAG